MSRLKDDRMFVHQQPFPPDWNRKCLPQDEYRQFKMEVARTEGADRFDHEVDAFVCNCGQFCLLD